MTWDGRLREAVGCHSEMMNTVLHCLVVKTPIQMNASLGEAEGCLNLLDPHKDIRTVGLKGVGTECLLGEDACAGLRDTLGHCCPVVVHCNVGEVAGHTFAHHTSLHPPMGRHGA